jgi:hypothetical protein
MAADSSKAESKNPEFRPEEELAKPSQRLYDVTPSTQKTM